MYARVVSHVAVPWAVAPGQMGHLFAGQLSTGLQPAPEVSAALGVRQLTVGLRIICRGEGGSKHGESWRRLRHECFCSPSVRAEMTRGSCCGSSAAAVPAAKISAACLSSLTPAAVCAPCADSPHLVTRCAKYAASAAGQGALSSGRG